MKKKLLSFIIFSICCLNSCNNNNKISEDNEPATPILKAAVFADVQLTTNNQDATSNAYLALLDHLKFSKENNVDVLFMDGDIVNNAIESYYQKFEEALKKVYGEDESTYPEFVYTVGNHEWWDKDEQYDRDALTLFKKYARIETDCLKGQSSYPYSMNQKETVPTYYKVVNGVPFISYSGEGSGGQTSSNTLDEIKTWLDDASNLPLVKKGGPIVFGYHYPLDKYTYDASNYNSRALIKLLKNYPNTIVFTGDTHYPSVNERTINQIDFTSINIGSSSYSRMVNHSATSIDNMTYTNVGSSAKDIVTGDNAFMSYYAENIQLLTVDSKGNTTIERYMNNKDISKVSKVGMTWNIDAFTSVDNFKYTSKRYLNKDWALKLYGKEALTWNDNDNVEYAIKNDVMSVKFNDVTDKNACEHYIIEVETDGDKVKRYDFVSNYYIYDTKEHSNNFEITGFELGNSYKVSVTAYDFFDNPSSKTLVATSPSTNTIFADDIDKNIYNAYSNTSKRINYKVTSNSPSSVEYYYSGDKNYENGMILAYYVSANESINNKKYFNIENTSNATISVDIYNLNDYDLTMLLEINGSPMKNNTKTVKNIGGFVTLTWNLASDFGINDFSTISSLALSAKVPSENVDLENGYSMSVIADNFDIK